MTRFLPEVADDHVELSPCCLGIAVPLGIQAVSLLMSGIHACSSLEIRRCSVCGEWLRRYLRFRLCEPACREILTRAERAPNIIRDFLLESIDAGAAERWREWQKRDIRWIVLPVPATQLCTVCQALRHTPEGYQRAIVTALGPDRETAMYGVVQYPKINEATSEVE